MTFHVPTTMISGLFGKETRTLARSLCGYIAQQTSPKKASSINISRAREPTGGCCAGLSCFAVCLLWLVLCQCSVTGVEVVFVAVFVGDSGGSGRGASIPSWTVQLLERCRSLRPKVCLRGLR